MMIIIIMIIIIIICIFNINRSIESFQLYKEKTLANCLNLCKESRHCYGAVFGTPKSAKNNKCLLSREPINVKELLGKLFYNSNNDTDVVCVKPYNEYESKLCPSLAERRRKSIFICTDKLNSTPKNYLHNNDQLYQIHEKVMLDNIKDIKPYTIKNYLY